MPPVPTASIVSEVAAVVLLVAVGTGLLRAYRDRGAERPAMGPLEQAQSAAILVAIVGLCVGVFADSGAVDAVWAVAVLTALALAVVRWRRRERPLPRWL